MQQINDKNKLKIFNNAEFGNIRAVEIDGKPYAVGVDIARALGYASPSRAIIDHCKGMCKLGIPSSGGIQETNVITEGDIYRLIVKAADQSRNSTIKEKAARFERWIFDYVLPSIRKHGAYVTSSKLEEIMNDPDAWIKLLTTLKEERNQTERLRTQIESDKPKVIFADAVAVSDDAILIGELAKILKGNGVDIGQNRLFERLRQEGFLIRSNRTDYNTPTQKAMKLGLFKIKETAITHSDGRVTISKTAKITGKGQQYFVAYFLGKNGGDNAAN
ncbi:MAG: phage antirepressor KilAC domain-containing protein [Holosporales bacterium]|jgi:anti-repressor protein|nr:phage antirepressor KilAC domain-containing protein [Holosporales bacterium]